MQIKSLNNIQNTREPYFSSLDWRTLKVRAFKSYLEYPNPRIPIFFYKIYCKLWNNVFKFNGEGITINNLSYKFYKNRIESLVLILKNSNLSITSQGTKI